MSARLRDRCERRARLRAVSIWVLGLVGPLRLVGAESERRVAPPAGLCQRLLARACRHTSRVMYVVLCIRIHRTDSARTTTMRRNCDTALRSYLAAGRVAKAWAAPQRSRTNPAPREVGSLDSLELLAGLRSKASSRAQTCSGRKRRAASGRQRSVAEVLAPCFVGVYMRQLEPHAAQSDQISDIRRP